MLRKENSRSYQEFSDDGYEQTAHACEEVRVNPGESDDSAFPVGEDDAVVSNTLRGFNSACLKNVFSTLLMFIYLLLTTVAVFLAYQTITDFMEKLSHPVMSVNYKEVDSFEPAGIALYLGKAQLLSCKHHHHAYIPPLVSPGQPEEGDCVTEEVTYMGPYSNHTRKTALVVQGPTDVRNRELIFLQFSQNETGEDFSSISYMLFSRFSDLTKSTDKAAFMQGCERNYSIWMFSGGFRTWVKMSFVKTSGKGVESVEFRQESSVVKYNDRRAESERDNQLFFIVFEWRDPFIQEVHDVSCHNCSIVTANPWNTIAILCGVFMALFKAANFAKLSVKWMIKIRKRHLKHRERELTHIS
ncbi:hypothetical protein MATL_G00165550 [Megalops atlanticus]|uniref:Proton-activated chloride channel n=1 Tax=Megalops atlanticus TaxID=7932 RepID=A0A9D3PVP3_MEGAT|nr:hypothetical protein MATL_G00165550 [Megalops atlanticus]